MKTRRMICLISKMTWPMEKEAEMAFTFKVMSMIICIITRFHLNTSCRWRKKTMMEPFLCYKVHKEVSLNFVKMMHNRYCVSPGNVCTLRKVIRGSKGLNLIKENVLGCNHNVLPSGVGTPMQKGRGTHQIF